MYAQPEESTISRGRRIRMAASAVLCGLVVMVITGACSSDAGGGSVVIETRITFNNPEPAAGTFEVVEGADILGCSSGTFVDVEGALVEEDIRERTKVLDCETGTKVGTISVLFVAGLHENEFARQTGPWEVTDATDDFVGLIGDGDHLVEYFNPVSGKETLTGSIRFSGT